MGSYGDQSRLSTNAAKNLIVPPTGFGAVAVYWRNVQIRRTSGGCTIVTASSSAGGSGLHLPEDLAHDQTRCCCEEQVDLHGSSPIPASLSFTSNTCNL